MESREELVMVLLLVNMLENIVGKMWHFSSLSKEKTDFITFPYFY